MGFYLLKLVLLARGHRLSLCWPRKEPEVAILVITLTGNLSLDGH